ncbi:MAG: RimK family alpha-L-glutamate ligase [Acidimicrobiia bacterium]
MRSRRAPWRIHYLLARRVPPVPSPVLVAANAILERRGYRVTGWIAEETLIRPDELEPRHDLYLLKSHTELSLSLAGVLHSQGARVLNPYPACASAQDKLRTSRRLAAAGVPVPRSWTTSDLSLLSEALDETPLIVKPHNGHRGAGITIVRDRAQLAAMPAPSSPVIVQEYIPGPGHDLKVYVVGEEVFAVRKPFSESSFTQPGVPVPVTEDVRRVALRCGRAAGLGLYGIDVIESADGPVVVDLNHFPGYKGVADVAPLIAEYVDAYASGAVELGGTEPVPSLPDSAA